MSGRHGKLNSQSHNRLTIAAVLLFTAVVVLGGLSFLEAQLPDREAVDRVQKGLHRSDIVDLLGVMYDKSDRGEYESTDEAIARMENGSAISYVCRWRIRYSGDVFYVGFDSNDVAIAMTE